MSVIRAATGYQVEVVSGEDGALFGYAGAMRELRPTSGAFLDIGGASTEIVTFDEGKPDDCHSMTTEQLDELCDFLCDGKKEALDLILRLEAERVHTIVPGILILRHVLHLFRAKQMIVSKYGVREGYLCRRILGTGN